MSSIDASKEETESEQDVLLKALQLIDPLLQFLTKATGRTKIPLQSLKKIIPAEKQSVLVYIFQLYQRNVLHVEAPDELEDELEDILKGNDAEKIQKVLIGFPLPSDHFGEIGKADKKKKAATGLHGSTKAAAKRRLAALKKSFKVVKGSSKGKEKVTIEKDEAAVDDTSKQSKDIDENTLATSRGLDPNLMDGMVHNEKYQSYSVKEQLEKSRQQQEETSKDARDAMEELRKFFNRSGKKDIDDLNTSKKESDFILPKQAAYAGSKEKRQSQYQYLSRRHVDLIPCQIRDAFGLQLTEDGREEESSLAYQALDAHKGSYARRKLYSHQAAAIEAALDDKHCLVCTGTGSGKSLCFLLPILSDVMKSDMEASKCCASNEDGECLTSSAALLIFPTKALAQDQLTKLNEIIKKHPLMEKHIRAGIIDGDTPHQYREEIAKKCNILLTNPDTLHAAFLPGWKALYKTFLARLHFVVIDELHTYEGAFGAHVSLVFSRLIRITKVSNISSDTKLPSKKLTFIGCSATIGHPEDHFRLICPIAKTESIKVISPEEDGSPCSAKYFFVWNPPLLNDSGGDIGRVIVPENKKKRAVRFKNGSRKRSRLYKLSARSRGSEKASITDASETDPAEFNGFIKRSHAADETARLLAHAVRQGIRSIAFCKTRMLAEWVYERAIAILKDGDENSDLATKVEIYRGGYSANIRRKIERKLFQNELFGVVGTSALELGIDLGNIELTLHCGYPGSIASLMQQAGRAGRGASAKRASFAIMVCFSSPSEQHIWKHPKGLLGRGLDAPPSIPLTSNIVMGHLLCASEEFPLCGDRVVTDVLHCKESFNLSDTDLFGGVEVYKESLENLIDEKQIQTTQVNGMVNFTTYSKHPAVDRPFLRVSLRSIEPIQYSIVDLSHPKQDGRTDGIQDESAVMDSIPYSRVFYHAYPGAIIMHRGRRYKIHSMNAPPPFASAKGVYRNNSCNLGAYAKPSSANYSTRALSITLITIVKQFDRVEIEPLKKNALKEKGADDLNSNVSKIESEKDLNVSMIECEKKPSSEAEDSNGKQPENSKVNTEASSQGNQEEVTIHTQGQGIADLEEEFVPRLSRGTLAGNGVVNVKRTVHGYKKLSLVNREELSRSEISLPPMEYDTNAMWIDVEASTLNEYIPDLAKGVHALSHAILCVAPLFVPCTPSDLDCDHSHYECTRITLFDVRAGGAGTSAQLWKHFFKPQGVLEAAIELLSECPSGCDGGSYKGGCPGCIQSVPCINFHEDLCRRTGLQIAKRMLGRIKLSPLYQKNVLVMEKEKDHEIVDTEAFGTPRRKRRQKALTNAYNLVSARQRNVVVGRPSWATDNAHSSNREAVEPQELNDLSGNSLSRGPSSPQGGFMR